MLLYTLLTTLDAFEPQLASLLCMSHPKRALRLTSPSQSRRKTPRQPTRSWAHCPAQPPSRPLSRLRSAAPCRWHLLRRLRAVTWSVCRSLLRRHQGRQGQHLQTPGQHLAALGQKMRRWQVRTSYRSLWAASCWLASPSAATSTSTASSVNQRRVERASQTKSQLPAMCTMSSAVPTPSSYRLTTPNHSGPETLRGPRFLRSHRIGGIRRPTRCHPHAPPQLLCRQCNRRAPLFDAFLIASTHLTPSWARQRTNRGVCSIVRSLVAEPTTGA